MNNWLQKLCSNLNFIPSSQMEMSPAKNDRIVTTCDDEWYLFVEKFSSKKCQISGQ